LLQAPHFAFSLLRKSGAPSWIRNKQAAMVLHEKPLPNMQRAKTRTLAVGHLTSGAADGRQARAAGGSTASSRKPKHKEGEIPLASNISRFSLSSPPPFDARAADVLRLLLDTMPPELQCRAVKYEDDCMSKDAILLATHAFWYTFVALLLDNHERQRDQLLQLMALQYARLALNVSCSRDAFFEHFPLLVGHAVINVLRKHEALGANPQQQGPAAAGVFRHLVGLLGGHVPPPDKLRLHMRFAERGREDSQTAASRRANLYHVPWGYEPTPGPPQPALGRAVILPLPEIERPKSAEAPDPPAAAAAPGLASGLAASASLPVLKVAAGDGSGSGGGSAGGGTPGAGSGGGGAVGGGGGGGGSKVAALKSASVWAPVKNLLKAQKSIETAQVTSKQSASAGQLLARPGGQKYRPPKMAVDLRRQSPLVQIYRGASPAEVLARCGLPPLDPPNRSGFVPPPPPEVRRGPTVRQSVPGYGGKTRLGGAASYKAMQLPGLVKEGKRRVEEFEADGKMLEMNMRIFTAAIDSKCDEIGRSAEAKCRMDPPQLADYAFDLANQILHPDLLYEAART
jgi:uncharacterized membrane protein YgcG